ncbi:MAG: DUF6212 domain-containing protein [Pseudoruegeria sp.]
MMTDQLKIKSEERSLVIALPDGEVKDPKKIHALCKVGSAEDLEADFTFTQMVVLASWTQDRATLLKAYPRLSSMTSTKVMALGAKDKLSLDVLFPVLQELQGAVNQLLVDSQRAQAQTRMLYERLQQKFLALEEYVAQGHLPKLNIVYSNPVSEDHTLFAGKNLRRTLKESGKTFLEIAQPVPVAAEHLRGIEIGVRLDEPFEKSHHITLSDAGSEEVAMTWELTPGSQPLNNRIRLAIPAGTDLPRDAVLRMHLDIEEEPSRFEIIGSTHKADRNACARINGEAQAFPLHMQFWEASPAGAELHLEQSIAPQRQKITGGTVLDRERLAAGNLLSPSELQDHWFPIVAYHNERGLTVHPVSDQVICAVLPVPNGGARQFVEAYLCNGHEQNDGLEMAIGFASRQVSDVSELINPETGLPEGDHVSISPWVYLAPLATGSVRLETPVEMIAADYILIFSRLQDGAREGNAWAQVTDVLFG